MFTPAYENFTPDQQQIIATACTRAHQAAGRTLGADTPIAAWFGAADRNTVVQNLRKMHSVFNDGNRTVTFVNRTGGVLRVAYNADNLYQNHLMAPGQSEDLTDGAGTGAVAYAFPVDRRYGEAGPQSTISHVGSGMRIYLTEIFFDQAADDQAATVYHELTHKVLATNDHAYGTVGCRHLAADPNRALRNADSYALFALNC